MPQQPRFEELPTQKLVGISLPMSRVNDQTPQLWRSFMPNRGAVRNRSNQSFMSMQIYPAGPSQIANPDAVFIKWAAVQVTDFETSPADMSAYTLEGGLYAVFEHCGPATDLSTVLYIFQEWLPDSDYRLDDREHFELLPENYNPADPHAREEFWIPVERTPAKP